MSTQPIDEEVFYEGKFSLVQLNIPSTSELFNIGVIFEQSENNIFHTKFLDNFDRLTTCLRIKDIGNIQYSIDLLQKRIKQNNSLSIGNISRSIQISEPQTYAYYSNDFESEFSKLFMRKVSLATKQIAHREIRPKTKTDIINHIDTAIVKHSYTGVIKTRKYLTTTFGESKEFDTISYVNDSPAVIAQIIPFDHGFFDYYSKATSLLNVVASDRIQERIIYAPAYDKKISNYSQKMATLKETADDNGFTLLDTTSAEEFIGYIYEKTNILQLQE
jgi:hypothetical protein